jgi:prepilin peptidase CpaA
MLSTIALFVFPVLMAFAASSDLLTMRIANWLVLAIAAAFFAVAIAIGMPLSELGLHAACAVIVLLVGMAFYAFGWIGGGDAKLAAATSLWFGFGLTLPYLVYAALIGGWLTLMILALRRFPLTPLIARVGWIARLHEQKAGIPYGIALAAAGIITYSNTPIFHAFAG